MRAHNKDRLFHTKGVCTKKEYRKELCTNKRVGMGLCNQSYDLDHENESGFYLQQLNSECRSFLNIFQTDYVFLEMWVPH